jgi:Ca2+-binding EF-hand superfamily protein
MDTDGDGFIGKDQLRDFVRSLGEHDDELVANMMATADQAKDGRIGVAQFCRAFE